MAFLGSDKGSKRKGAHSGRPELISEPTAEGLFLFDEDDNEYAQTVVKTQRIKGPMRKIAIMGIILVVVVLVSMVLPDNLLSLQFPNGDPNEETQAGVWCNYGTFTEWFMRLGENVQKFAMTVAGQGDWDNYTSYIVAVLAGAGLALAGAVYQGAFRNPLVSPSTMGVMTGANVGKVVWVVALYGFILEYQSVNGYVEGRYVSGQYVNVSDIPDDIVYGVLFQDYSLSVVAFVFSLLVVGIVLLCTRFSKKASSSPLFIIITGQVIASIFSTFNGLVTYYYTVTDPWGQVTELLRGLQIATLFGNDFELAELLFIAALLVITFLVVMHERHAMMALGFGVAEARSMGIDTRRSQTIVVVLCTLLTAVVVSFCGTIGFIGFMVPHMARRLVGADFTYLLPAAAVLGALFVVSVWSIIMVLFGANAASLSGMFTSIAGGIIFLVTALKQRGSTAHGDWK